MLKATTWNAAGDPRPAAEPALRILHRLFAGMERPPALRLWDGRTLTLSQHPECTLVLRDPRVLRSLAAARNALPLADAYFRGVLDVEGDLYDALRLKRHLESVSLTARERLSLLRDVLLLLRGKTRGRAQSNPPPGFCSRIANGFSHRHSRDTDHAAIRFHYDLSNEFYGLWLDDERVYSCAYFAHPDDSLEAAQRQKLDHICRKLRLKPGDRFLDIGCGWGALVRWAAREYGVQAHGITLSKRQFDYAGSRIRAEGLQDRATIFLCDYRDLPDGSEYDKVASVGMFEHVGLANLPAYYAAVRRVLRPRGLFLNDGITHDTEGWQPETSARFVNRYVFPDGELDLLSNIQRGMERAGFEIHDVEGLRPHYAHTLRHWVQRLEAHREEARELVGEAAFRVWRLYMAACAVLFDVGEVGVYQILASTRGSGEDEGRWPVPWTRSDLYPERGRSVVAP